MAKALKFGVEIEFFGVTREVVEAALRRVGISAETENYNHNTRGHWKLVTDASVNSTGCGQGVGNELVSPVLYGEDGLKELELACKVLGEVGAKVDKTCGVHVHHDINGYNLQQIKNIYVIYARSNKAIDAMLPKSRRTENRPRFCKPMDEEYIQRVNSCNSIDQLKMRLGDRYYTVNFCSYVKYGTVEFRQHSGSVEFSKIGAWVQLTHRICEAAKTRFELKYDSAMARATKAASKWYVVKLAGNHKELRDFVLDRIAYFETREARAE